MTENLGALEGEAGLSGERSTTNRPKGMKGDKGEHACAFRHFGYLKGIAAQPLRRCRLTAQYLHHQNAETPSKEGKNKIKKTRK